MTTGEIFCYAIHDYEDGKKLVLDISIVHPLVLAISSKESPQQKERKKKDRNYFLCVTSLGYNYFRPIALEVYGHWKMTTEELLEEFSKYSLLALTTMTGQLDIQTTLETKNLSLSSA